VLRTDDTGGAWNDVTGNLAATAGAVRSVAYLPHATNDVVVIGTDVGVFATSRQRGFNLWSPLGTGFPRAPVFDLSYDAGRDLLLAGTLGRGSFTLARVAAAPVAANDTASTQRTTAVAVNVLANDTDVGGTLDASTVTIASPPPSGATTSIDGGTGAITYTPPAGFTGTETFAYRLRDDLGTLSNVALVTVRVNAPPAVVNDSVVTQRNTAIPISVLANDSDDVTIDATSVVIASPPASGTTSVAPSGVVTYTPAAGFTGTVTFTYTVEDDESIASSAATVTVRVNAPPVATNDSVVAQLNTALPITVLGNDSDADGTLATTTVAIASPPASGSASVAPSGVVTYTPAAGFTGTTTFMYTVQDNDAATSNTATVTVRVNAPPVASNDSVVAQRNTALSISVLGNDTDADGTLAVATVTVVSAPASGTTSVGPSGVVTYTPAAGFAGTVAFTYTVADNDGGVSNAATVTVRVNAVPAAANDSANTPSGTAVPITVLANDTDADGTLVAGSVAVASPPASGTTSVAPTGVVTYTPAAGFSGIATFTYTVTDNDGAVSSPATVTVTVVANAVPLANDDAITVATGGTATTLVGGASSLTANDSDANADPLTVTITPVAAPTRGALTLAANGTFSYVHGGTLFGYDEFTYEVCDGRGGCDIARVTIRIGDALFSNGYE